MEIEVVNYIKEARQHGLPDTEIKKNLLNAGWEAGAVEESFTYLRAVDARHDSLEMDQHMHTPEQAEPGPVINSVHAQSPSIEHVPHEHEAISPGVSIQSTPKSKKMLWISAAVVMIVLCLGAGAYFAYAYGYFNPAGVWKKFTQTKSSTIYQNKYKFTYSDPGSVDNDNLLGLQLKDIKVAIEGSAYVSASDPSNPTSKSDLQYTFSSGNTSFSTGFKSVLLNKVLYLNVGDNPLLKAFTSMGSESKKYDWVKFDFGEIEKEFSDGSNNEYKELQQILSPDFKTQLQKIWEDATLVKEDKYLGRETINGVSTLHFKNSVDKQALKSLVSAYVQKFVDVSKGWSQPMTDQDAQLVNEVSSQIIDKMEVKEFETWIGARDFKLYRVHLVSNAPSIISLVKNAKDINLGESSDAKRLADVRQMASAMELYYNDNNGYPDGKDGNPLNLTPTYIGIIPVAPAPNGTCTDYYNTYWYQPKGMKSISATTGKTLYSSYELTFCLGNTTGGYKAGIAKLSPSGIQDSVACPTTSEQCSKPSTGGPDEEMKKQIKDFVSKLDFSATISADADYSDYGKNVNVGAPSEYFDILNALGDARSKSRDAKRMADVRQMASAQELYFNDKSEYPKKLVDLTPTYIGIIPTPPTPNDGTCTPEQNAYAYKYVNKEKYEITFCLGTTTNGYSAGVHTLTPAGIQ